ncbi:MAG: bifunctional DNA primase/polymerase [Planctomycetia bacterium]|nr:bifunctional DNA primase/polymerase [Planctomycetia bacterium]
MTITVTSSFIDAAAALRVGGFALVWLRPGEKRPGRRNWTASSQEPGDYRPGSNLGVLCGRLSDDLVCIDLDAAAAIERAGAALPATGMIDGRPGKPMSHWWY